MDKQATLVLALLSVLALLCAGMLAGTMITGCEDPEDPPAVPDEPEAVVVETGMGDTWDKLQASGWDGNVAWHTFEGVTTYKLMVRYDDPSHPIGSRTLAKTGLDLVTLIEDTIIAVGNGEHGQQP